MFGLQLPNVFLQQSWQYFSKISKHVFPSSAMKRVGLSNYFPQKYNFTLMSHYCANDTFESQFELLSLEQQLKPNQIYQRNESVDGYGMFNKL